MPHSLSNWLMHLEELSAIRGMPASSQTRAGRLNALSTVATDLGLLPWSASSVVTVAGTNGKGSCVALLASLFQAGGYQVGSFTSPHLIHYNERIQINQQSVSDQSLCEAFTRIEEVRGDILLGYFEFTLLAGLLLFEQALLDVVILEVGLGGRLDPVNLLDAEVTVISSIALDHTHILGGTEEAIAFEKAGIMRSRKPCVWGASKVPKKVKDHAQSLNTPLFVYGDHFNGIPTSVGWTFTSQKRHLEGLIVPNVTYLPNAACALKVVELSEEWLPITREAIQKGLRQVSIPGRFQVIEGRVKTILDVAHNPASAELLACNLNQRMPAKHILMVIATVNAKDKVGILSPLLDKVDHWYVGQFELKNRTPATELADCLASLSVSHYSVYGSVVEAYQAALDEAQPSELIVVMGSFHTVGAVLEFIESQ